METLRKDIDVILNADELSIKSTTKQQYNHATTEFPEDYVTLYKNASPAFEMKYEPYPYQKQAAVLVDSIYGLQPNCPPTNVLVASPTGSGKTFAIKWAAYRAIQNGHRLIIAVPLVALAEQIYFELRQLLSGETAPDLDCEQYPEYFDYRDDYGDYDEYYHSVDSYVSYNSTTNAEEESCVGIRTGPSEKFPDAPVLVCTYEVVLIQMNQNYRFMDNCPLLIIDEIHMISDPSRGHVPENIMNHPNMPYQTKIIGLSGTLPNSLELAEFMGRTNRTETRIIGAKRRPISLDYYIHTGDTGYARRKRKKEREESDKQENQNQGTDKLESCNEIESNTESSEDEVEEQIFHHVYNSEEKQFNHETWKEVCGHKMLKHMNTNQQKTKILDLIENLRSDQKLPAMVVGFSCKRLNRLAGYLDSVNLCENKRCSSMVHIEFNKLKKRIPAEEWSLFEPFKELAKRGIGVHHSQNPKHYLELLPKLVKKGYVKLVFATSSLSAGIDLPVRTVVITDLKMPSENGFVPIETNLFHQICGRAGRPGLETQGNVVITKWKSNQDVNIETMITTPPKPVTSQYKLTPSTILNILLKDDADSTVNKLVLHSFSTANTHNISEVIIRCMKYMKQNATETLQPIIDALHLLEQIRNQADECISEFWKDMRKQFRVGRTIYVDPEKGHITPIETKIRRIDGNTLHTDDGIVQKSWVFYIKEAIYKRMSLETHTLYNSLKTNIATLRTQNITCTAEEFEKAREWSELKRCVAQLKFKVSPEASVLWDEYQRTIKILKQHKFINKKEMPTMKGKMAAHILSAEDPLTLVEFLTNTEYDENDIVPILTIFLRTKRNNDPMGDTLYSKIVGIQKKIWKMKNTSLGTTMIDPMKMWMAGSSVAQIVQQCDISVGHFCKEALRMKELLTQIADTCTNIGDFELHDTIARQNSRLQRGLPFLSSSFLH